MACGILVTDHFSRLPTEAVVLAAATFAAALARLVWTLREVRSLALHRREALTDDLTGLPNRRALFRELEVLTAAGDRSSRAPGAARSSTSTGSRSSTTRSAMPRATTCWSPSAAAWRPSCPARCPRAWAGTSSPRWCPRATTRARSPTRIGDALHAPLDIDGVGVAINASVGIAHFPQDAQDARELARRADVAMYDAKRLGTVVAGYTPEHDEHSLDRLALAADLRSAFDRDELWLAFQPQVDIATGRISGAEALIRWKHPTRGDVPPGVLLPIAERTGLMPQLTLWVLDRAVAQAAALAPRRPRRPHGRQRVGDRAASTSTLPDRIAETLTRHALTSDNLVIEVTEDAVMRDPRRAIDILGRIKASGARSPSTTSAPASRRWSSSRTCRPTSSSSTARSCSAWPRTRTTRRSSARSSAWAARSGCG